MQMSPALVVRPFWPLLSWHVWVQCYQMPFCTPCIGQTLLGSWGSET